VRKKCIILGRCNASYGLFSLGSDTSQAYLIVWWSLICQIPPDFVTKYKVEPSGAICGRHSHAGLLTLGPRFTGCSQGEETLARLTNGRRVP